MKVFKRDAVIGEVEDRCVVEIFFFQAEDGIRDLVRSRGLGDVYKRQPMFTSLNVVRMALLACDCNRRSAILARRRDIGTPVSYTHLTLPTSDLV